MRNPSPEAVTPTTPLRLETAARLAFPDGSISVKALRELGHAGKLNVEKIAGKDFTTLAYIEEMRERCRVPAKAQGSERKSETESSGGSSATVSTTVAQDALSEKVRKATAASKPRKKNSRNTSAESTTQKPAEVIPLKPL